MPTNIFAIVLPSNRAMKKYIENPKQKNPPVVNSVQQPNALPPRVSVYHALWAERHTKQDPTTEWFSDWLNRVPKSCGCDKSLQASLDELGPPDYADWFAFSVRLHNAVNRKLSKPEIDIETARAIWQ